MYGLLVPSHSQIFFLGATLRIPVTAHRITTGPGKHTKEGAQRSNQYFWW